LDLVRSNEHLGESYIQEDFKIPTLNDIRNAQPVARVLPKDVVGHATLIATTLASGGEQDVLLSLNTPDSFPIDRAFPADDVGQPACAPRSIPGRGRLWYEKRLRQGVQVFIAHPRLVETGLDLLLAPIIIFYESGYSLHTLRQASRRS
jgi:hypothetical protein